MAELQTRLSLEEQREEERGKEVFICKQKLTETQTARDSLKREVSENFYQLFPTLASHMLSFLSSSP